MRIHHLSCATLCPAGRRFINGSGGLFEAGHVCCHCLLIETGEGLVLVDTGLSHDDLADTRRLQLPLRLLMRPVQDPLQSALGQLRARGFRAEDVRHIVVTHLDFDHAGALVDFPHATVHVFADEHTAAMHPRGLNERERYHRRLWQHGVRWQVHALAGERWEGFAGVRCIPGTEILLVPFAGHTRGHCAVAVRDGDRWLLHCGDAYFFHGEMEQPPHCPPVLSFFQRAIARDNGLRVANQARLNALAQEAAGRVRLFCAHDPVELERLQQGR